MDSPGRYLLRMLLCLAAVVLVIVLLQEGVTQAFIANPYLNGLIVAVFLFGVGLNFRQVLRLKPEMRWLDDWRNGRPQLSSGHLRLLAPMATMLGEKRSNRINLSAMALRSLLDSIASRLDEGRDLSRYFIGLMIFLGLLGTFWGLSQTVGSIGNVIGSLSIDGTDDMVLAFESLKGGLEAPLVGMGTAFSTSLFGLAGSVVLGFLDLQAGQAQNVFYNSLEELLAGQTRLGGVMARSEGGEQSVPAYIQALLEQTADSLDSLQRIIAKGEESRSNSSGNMHILIDKLSTLSDHMKAEQQLLLKLGESQLEVRPLLMRLAEQTGGGLDEVSRGHLRNLDLQISRLVEINSQGYESLSSDLRHEFRLLARTIAAVADDIET